VNTLRLAIDGYEVVQSMLRAALDEGHTDRAEDWLRDEVVPVCPELFQSRRFRLAARWPLDHLSNGAPTAERGLVEATDAAIVRFAQELESVMAADYPRVPNAACLRTGSASESLETIRWIASRPWVDLVCGEEYFQPHRGLHLWAPEREPPAADDQFSKIDVPLGDYVTRSLWARIDYWTELLNRSAMMVYIERSLPLPVIDQLFLPKLALDESIKGLKDVCFPHEHQLRDAAIVLTQVYSAYAPVPRLDWLPCPPDLAEANRDLVRLAVRRPYTMGGESDGLVSVCNPTVLREIALALQSAKTFYEVPEDADEVIEWAKDRARLMLVDRSPREVYWEGVAVAADRWDVSTNEWNLLWMLARNSNRVVDQGMLIAPQGEAIRSRRNRLSRLLMESAGGLDAAIESIRSQGYQLMLDAEDVCLLRDDGTGYLVFEGAARSFP
jgi:hypothetical protein